MPLTVIAQVESVPVQAPDQPPKAEKVEVPPGVSVRVTCVPSLKFAEQVPGQLIPAGLLVIVPVTGLVAVTVTSIELEPV